MKKRRFFAYSRNPLIDNAKRSEKKRQFFPKKRRFICKNRRFILPKRRFILPKRRFVRIKRRFIFVIWQFLKINRLARCKNSLFHHGRICLFTVFFCFLERDNEQCPLRWGACNIVVSNGIQYTISKQKHQKI